MTSLEQRLVTLWDSTLESRVARLAHDDAELALLRPLTAAPTAALVLAEHLSHSDRPVARISAATLVGLLPVQAPVTLLTTLLEAERARRKLARSDDDRHACDAVIDAVMRAAARWAGSPARAAAAQKVLARLAANERAAVERAVTEADQRSNAITFSDEGRAVIAQWQALATQVDAR